jgi:plasmid stabilization system protein ParE
MSQYAIAISDQAAGEIDAALTWARDHQGAVRVAQINDEIARALRYLNRFPYLGPLAPDSSTVQRLRLGPSGYQLFYRVFPAKKLIMVGRFRHERQRPLKL